MMKKTILLTGATDGIGFETAKMLINEGHDLLIHGRSESKLNKVADILATLSNSSVIHTYIADLSNIEAVKDFADNIKQNHKKIDVLINNAGVFKVNTPISSNGLDVRFIVNTISPYILTKQLASVLGKSSRVINLSSAAQAPVSIQALLGNDKLTDMEAYSQSKLAITMWTHYLANTSTENSPTFISVNPGSLLASKMVKEGFGVAGNDLSIGAKILTRLSTEDGIEKYSGLYFDNDSGDFSPPHPDGMDMLKSEKLVEAMDALLNQ
jgi:NAD(P)-dependent dehydrogenase (short-subunit alcohol dehydrogenase family)